MKRYRSLLGALLSALTALSLLVSGAQRADAQTTGGGWAWVSGVPVSLTLTDVVMVERYRAWAVGYDGATGVIYELLDSAGDGRWRALSRASFGAPLHAVAVTPAGDVWAVGDDGMIVHSLPRGQWTIEQPIPGAALRAIQILGNDQRRWAGGYITRPDAADEPVMLRSDGAEWYRDSDIAGEGRVEDLHFAPGGGWAVGGERIWRYQDAAWRSEQLPATCGGGACAAGLAAVRAIDGDTAWAVGTRHGMCAICVSRPLAIQRDGGVWRSVLPDSPIAGWNPTPNQITSSTLSDIWFGADGRGVAVGTWINRENAAGPRPIIAAYAGGVWSLMPAPDARITLTAVSMIDPEHGLAVGANGVLLAYGYGAQGETPPPGNPAAPVANPGLPGVRYFGETSHTLRGVFLRYWSANGGLEQFGYPITEEFQEINPDDGRTYLVQYYERARFEYHPELAGTRYEVLLGLLGHTVTAGRKSEGPFLPTARGSLPGARYYAETGHHMAPEFAGYWERTGGLEQFGYPITEEFQEISPTDGRIYLVQYFERNRLEYHPELAGTRYEVLLGLLGSEVLRARGWR